MGIPTRCNCIVSAKRVRISISRRCGCQDRKAAARNSVYRPTDWAMVAGIGGMVSVTRLSGGATTSAAGGLERGPQKLGNKQRGEWLGQTPPVSRDYRVRKR